MICGLNKLVLIPGSTKIILGTYSNDNLNVLGKLSMTAQYKENILTKFLLYVISGNSVNLLRHNWLSQIKVDWTYIIVVRGGSYIDFRTQCVIMTQTR